MNVLIITACPSGVATTFLASRGLERAAKRRGWNATVEMHSQLEPVVPIGRAALEAADLVVIAASAPVELARFIGKRVYQAPIASIVPFILPSALSLSPSASESMEDSQRRPIEEGVIESAIVSAALAFSLSPDSA